jgi:hypothetical protein
LTFEIRYIDAHHGDFLISRPKSTVLKSDARTAAAQACTIVMATRLQHSTPVAS